MLRENDITTSLAAAGVWGGGRGCCRGLQCLAALEEEVIEVVRSGGGGLQGWHGEAAGAGEYSNESRGRRRCCSSEELKGGSPVDDEFGGG